MNPEAEKRLREITKKELPELDKYDVAFLRARKSYLTKSELEYFAPVLDGKAPTVKIK